MVLRFRIKSQVSASFCFEVSLLIRNTIKQIQAGVGRIWFSVQNKCKIVEPAIHNQTVKKCHGRQLVAFMVQRYDVYPECERPGFNSPLRHRIFLSIRSHLYIWCPMLGSINLCIVCLVRSGRIHFSQKGCHGS